MSGAGSIPVEYWGKTEEWAGCTGPERESLTTQERTALPEAEENHRQQHAPLCRTHAVTWPQKPEDSDCQALVISTSGSCKACRLIQAHVQLSRVQLN